MAPPSNTRAFLVGASLGLLLSAVVYYVFSFVVTSPISDIVVSGTTLLGIGFSAGGYFFHWRGDNSMATFFVTGFGAGIILVAFLGAGAGLSPFINS